ncbi:MAG: DUF2142 domain-containing protein [Nocardioides sp.]
MHASEVRVVLSRSARVPLLFFAGTLLMQTAWILALPPFRGSDEFDHAYRAASVAEGFWQPAHIPPSQGRGDMIPVPREVVEDARAVCETYEYTSPSNCRPGTELGDGLVSVASGASRYNPVFYWLIGTPAQGASGAAGLYLMRLVAALLCSLLIAASVWSIGSWATTAWPLRSLTLALTPVTAYSTAVAAPNGFEMAAALCLWTSLLGLATQRGRALHARSLLMLASISALGLVTVRTLGPLWLILAFTAAVPLIGRYGLTELIRTHRRLVTSATITIGAAALASIIWTLSVRPNEMEVIQTATLNRYTRSLGQVPLWFFQSIAAFPVRNEIAPIAVYGCAASVFVTFMALALRQASLVGRMVILAIAGVSLLLPLIFTILTYRTAGLVWQGRYTLPLSFGTVLIAGWALDRASYTHRLLGPFVVSGFACLAIAHTASVVNVLQRELRSSPLSGDPRWIVAPPWFVGALSLLAIAAWALAALEQRRQLSTVEPSPNDLVDNGSETRAEQSDGGGGSDPAVQGGLS